MRALLMVCSVVAASMLPGCGESGELAPPALALGHDVCAVCGMSVSDDRYAAAVVVRDAGRDSTLLLDDLGELPALAIPAHDEIAIFVCDEGTREWVRAEEAHYVKAEGLRTPMGFGIAAMASADRARARAQELSGRAITFQELDPRR